jgi:uncharacterized protein (TIGR02266 family)
VTVEVRRKILIIDDVPMFREIESLFLARSGQVITAAGGDEGLAIAQREHPDVILTDLHMPGMGGDELCRRIKADPDLGRTPVIMVTGCDDGDEHEIAVRAGASDVVEKPVNRVSLIQTVNHFLRLAERGLVRVPLETEVRLDVPGREILGWSRNVSRGGMFVEYDQAAPEPDSVLKLEFLLPELPTEMPHALSPTAKVVWRRRATGVGRPGMGLQFLKLDARSAQRISDFVYEHAGTETDVEARAQNQPPA